MTHDPLIARLAAANPVPTGATLPRTEQRSHSRRAALTLALCVAVAAPAVAFADQIGNLLDLSNQGTPVATRDIPEAQDAGLERAMQEFGFPSTMHLLGARESISFYAARGPGGGFCFAMISSDVGQTVGCTDQFPSQQVFGNGGIGSVM